jgi:ribosomal protein S18 acetylase RimI-like enzyme
VELQRIYTHLSGKGVGQFLMDFSIELALKNHSKLIWLQVMDTSTQAIRFYEKNGFQICGAHTLSYEKMKPQLRGMFTMKRHF